MDGLHPVNAINEDLFSRPVSELKTLVSVAVPQTNEDKHSRTSKIREGDIGSDMSMSMSYVSPILTF